MAQGNTGLVKEMNSINGAGGIYMKKAIIVISMLFLIGVILGGCGLRQSPDEQAVKAVVENYDLSSFMQDGEEVITTQSAAQGGSAQPMEAGFPVSARYVHVGLNKTVDQVVVDSETGTAQAKMAVVYRGKFELLDLEGNVVSSKDAVIRGQANYTVQKENDQWKIIDLDLQVTTGDQAPVLESIMVSPAPVKVNQWVTIKAAFRGVGVNDLVLAIVQNPRAGIRTALWDDHIWTIDDVEGDGVYTGATYVHQTAVAGKHVGVVKAISLGNLLDPARDRNTPIPVTFTLKTFTMEVTE